MYIEEASSLPPGGSLSAEVIESLHRRGIKKGTPDFYIWSDFPGRESPVAVISDLS